MPVGRQISTGGMSTNERHNSNYNRRVTNLCKLHKYIIISPVSCRIVKDSARAAEPRAPAAPTATAYPRARRTRGKPPAEKPEWAGAEGRCEIDDLDVAAWCKAQHWGPAQNPDLGLDRASKHAGTRQKRRRLCVTTKYLSG